MHPRTNTNLHQSYESLLEEIAFPASFTDEEGRFIAVNTSFLSTYRLPIHEVIGQTPWLIASKQFPQALSDEISNATANRGWLGRVPNQDRTNRELDMFLVTRRLQTKSGVLQLGVACPTGNEDALLNSLLDVFCSAVGTVEPPTKLSQREQQAALLLAKGLSQKEIAWKMNLAPSTVRVLLSRVRAKQG